MPGVYISESVIQAFADEYGGYNEAKAKVKELAKDHAEELVDDE